MFVEMAMPKYEKMSTKKRAFKSSDLKARFGIMTKLLYEHWPTDNVSSQQAL